MIELLTTGIVLLLVTIILDVVQRIDRKKKMDAALKQAERALMVANESHPCPLYYDALKSVVAVR